MNQSSARLALVVGLLVFPFGLLCAQEGPPPEQYEPPPPVGVDASYFAPPKNTISIGLRVLSGPRISVSSTFGIVPFSTNPGDPNNTSITSRTYDDGAVFPDTRTDSNGNPITPDGRTNSWNYLSDSQLTADRNGVMMHSSSAVIGGSNPQSGKSDAGSGFELTFERDFGWHVGRVHFDLIAGLGGNDIHYILTKFVPADVTTITDTYSVYAPETNADGSLKLDANGNPQYPSTPSGPPTAQAFPSNTTDANGNVVNNTTLLDGQPNQGNDPNTPSSRQESTVHTADQVTDQWHVRGAYFTFRAGAKITVPITNRFHFSVSTGPALVYVGTTFSVTQTINTTSINTSSKVTDGFSTVLPAYFADADMEYWLTDRTGFYAGAVYQTSTGYSQTIRSENGSFRTRIEFGDQEGVRMGLSFKF